MRPPNAPWKPLPVSQNGAGGYASFYYSDDLSPLAVRWITKPGDNKSDPNLETLTYGLVSTCGPGLRAGVVKRGFPYVFFVTSRGGKRVLAGYYEIGWYAIGNLGRQRDYHLAAREAWFIRDPIPLAAVDAKCKTTLAQPFRTMRLLNPKQVVCILKLLRQYENALPEYLLEIDRLERFNAKYTKFRCWRREKPFDWSDARPVLAANIPSSSVVVNSSPSGRWKCANCGDIISNKALLRICPSCSAAGSLRPVN